jgi:predicted phosphodiesterase
MSPQNSVSFENLEKVALLSDIHANYPALQAVLEDITFRGINVIWLLGDALGRGPYPVEVFHWMQETFFKEKNLIVIGNHDEWIDKEGGRPVGGDANPMFVASDMLEYHELSQIPDFFDWMEKIPVECWAAVDSSYQFFLRHEYFLNSPKEVCYPWTRNVIEENMNWLVHQKSQQVNVMLLGHSHIPMLCLQTGETIESRKVIPFRIYFLNESKNWIINPGSIGYPIDRDTRASYGVFDLKSGTYQLIKVTYPLDEVNNKIVEKKYPQSIIPQLLSAPLPSSVPYDWLDHFDAAREVKESHG